MQIHLIVGLNGPDSIATLERSIATIYPGRHRKLADRPAWLVAENATASSVSERLGITTGTGGISALVMTMADYYGRAEPDLWSWIKVQWEALDGSDDKTATKAA